MIRRLVPAALHRLLYRLAYWLRAAYWRALRPEVHGCRIVALDGEGRVLLVRQTYGPRTWALPAGGMARGEDPIETASRELREETACLLEAAAKVDELLERPHRAHNVVHVVVGRTGSVPVCDRREVAEARFFALDALPAELHPSRHRALPRWIATYSSRS